MPTIETLADWNARLSQCGCCPMPSCLGPIINCQTIYGEFNTDYDAGIASGLYLDYVYYTDYTNCTESVTFTYSVLIEGSICDYELPPAAYTSFASDPCDPSTGTITGYRSVGGTPYTPQQFLIDILPIFNDKADFTNAQCTIYEDEYEPFSTACFSFTHAPTTFGAQIYTADLTVTRFRWKIPDGHLGTYFKITWDILNEPTGWNTTTLLRTYFLEDQTYEWTGAAGGGTNRYSNWYTIPTPDFVGERRIVNIRYECYRSTDYGNKPQVTGEAVTLPDT